MDFNLKARCIKRLMLPCKAHGDFAVFRVCLNFFSPGARTRGGLFPKIIPWKPVANIDRIKLLKKSCAAKGKKSFCSISCGIRRIPVFKNPADGFYRARSIFYYEGKAHCFQLGRERGTRGF